MDPCIGKISRRKDRLPTPVFLGFPGGSDSKESTCNVGDLGLIPGLGRSPGEGNGYPLQYSCLENSMDRGAWQAPVHGVAKSWTQLSDFHFHLMLRLMLQYLGHFMWRADSLEKTPMLRTIDSKRRKRAAEDELVR